MNIAIIGAGAAGCFAAANIPFLEGVQVAVFEKTGKALQKVKASGGGRCNVTHHCFDIPELLTRYPRGKAILRKTLYQFRPQDTIAWFEERGTKLKTEADGRMFPITDSSQTIIDTIWQQMMRHQVQVFFHKAVTSIVAAEEGGGYVLHFADGSTYEAQKVLITVGGSPKKDQYNWLQELGHTIEVPVPSLFTFNMPGNPITALMGVSVADAQVKLAGTKIVTQGPLLITHWGMSGPAILKASAMGARQLAEAGYRFQAVVNWLGGMKDAELATTLQGMRQNQGRQLLHHKNPLELPKRLWEHLLLQCGIQDDVRWGDLTAPARHQLTEHLLRDTYQVNGKTTFKEEFVTCGGISLADLDAQTMESRKAPGIYFAGEVLDADGITGGYNFQHAWSSGYVAAKALGGIPPNE